MRGRSIAGFGGGEGVPLGSLHVESSLARCFPPASYYRFSNFA
jgi:hypothetical protein